MQTSVRTASHLTPASPSALLRTAVAGVALSGASALLWAGILAGGPELVAASVSAALAVVGALVWEIRPRVGYAILTVDGVVAMLVTAFLLVTRGSVPWMLVAFWGSSAVLLASMLHLMGGAGPERSTTVTVVAVISLLALTALGLGEFVRATWTPGELSVLRSLPIYESGEPGPAAVVKTSAPVSGGEWGASWTVITKAPAAQFARMSVELTAEGWNVSKQSATSLLAEKDGYTLGLQASVSPEAIAPGLSSAPSSATAGDAYVMHLIAHVSESPAALMSH